MFSQYFNISMPAGLLLLSHVFIEASDLSHVVSCHKEVCFRKSKSHLEDYYGYRKRETHARVFSRTLGHGNSKIEIRQLKIKGKKARRKE